MVTKAREQQIICVWPKNTVRAGASTEPGQPCSNESRLALGAVGSRSSIRDHTRANRWRVSGGLRLDNFRREYPQLPEFPGCETMAGLALQQFEVVPVAGESVVVAGLRLTVQTADERRIRDLLVEAVKKR